MSFSLILQDTKRSGSQEFIKTLVTLGVLWAPVYLQSEADQGPLVGVLINIIKMADQGQVWGWGCGVGWANPEREGHGGYNLYSERNQAWMIHILRK